MPTSATHRRACAAEIRAKARRINHVLLRETMLAVAETYDRMAELEERRAQRPHLQPPKRD